MAKLTPASGAPPEARRKPLEMMEDLDFSGTPGWAQSSKIAGLLTQRGLRCNTAKELSSGRLGAVLTMILARGAANRQWTAETPDSQSSNAAIRLHLGLP